MHDSAEARAQLGGLLSRLLIEFRGARGKLIHRRVLDPGTTMAYSGDGLSRGYYRVVLIASWPKREGRWVFGLKGPLGAA